MGTREKKDRVQRRRVAKDDRELYDRSLNALRTAISDCTSVDNVVFVPLEDHVMLGAKNPVGTWNRPVPTFISASVIACTMLLSLAIFN